MLTVGVEFVAVAPQAAEDLVHLRVPDGVVLHYGEVAEGDRRWFGPVSATAPLRTLEDCAAEHLPPDLLRGAVRDALDRGWVTRDELASVQAALEPFGGLEP